MKLLPLILICALGTGCRSLYCGDCCDPDAAGGVASKSLDTTEHTGADCTIQVEPGGLATEMDLAYNSTISPVSIPVPPVIVEMKTAGSNYSVGGVSVPASSKKNLQVQVDLNGTSASIDGNSVSFSSSTSSMNTSSPVVFVTDIESSKDFQLHVSYNGTLLEIDCVHVP